MHKSKFIDCQQQKRRRTTKQFIIMPYMGCHTCTHTSGIATENRSSVQHTDRKIYLISTISIQILGVDGISDINKLLLRIFDRFWLGPGDFVFENIDNLSVLCYSTAWHRVAWHREGDKSCVKIFECVKFQSFGSRLWNTVTVFCLCKICWEISAVDIVCVSKRKFGYLKNCLSKCMPLWLWPIVTILCMCINTINNHRNECKGMHYGLLAIQYRPSFD